MRSAVLAFCFLLLVGTADARAQIEINDYVSEFTSGYKRLPDKSAAIVRSYVETYLDSHRVLFEEVYGKTSVQTSTRREEVLRALIKDSGELVPKMDERLASLRKICTETEARFLELFGARPKTKLYAWIALADTDGIATKIGGTQAFALNFRITAKQGEMENKILIAHEMFHVLQAQLLGADGLDETLLSQVMSEGFATYGSELAVPGLPAWKYLAYWKTDDSHLKEYQKHDRAIRQAISKDRDASGWDRTKQYLLGDAAMTAPLPPRSAYYLGYLLAKDAQSGRATRDWARMTLREFRALALMRME